MEEQERLARMGRAPQPTSSADTGGRSGGEDSDAEVDHRQKESLLVMKAKQMQEVRAALAVWAAIKEPVSACPLHNIVPIACRAPSTRRLTQAAIRSPP